MHLLVTDFDETVTKKDTISTLAELPYLHKSFPVPWAHFVDTYNQGYQKFTVANRDLPILNVWNSNREQLITVGNYEQMFRAEIDYQKSMRPIELNSIQELEDKGAFTNITLDQVRELSRARTNLLRDDFLEAWRAVSEVHILSVNWSRVFIESMLACAVTTDEATGINPPVQTTCNDLIAEEGRLTGKFNKAVVTGYDKIEELKKLLKASSATRTIWYVGDSETDLLSTLYPGVNGVILLDPEENRKKFDKITSVLGVKHEDLKGYSTARDLDCVKISCKMNGALYFVKSWKALVRLLRQ
ncbi:LAME_0E11518g1_1 [Lachancea meyersii CBS 8951]|uniref:LAME_0E11518g1_1 n=1 Tax=Lachancea meyersii CBS 8951 TaxID=1266667 RepID=A0A1G4JKS7_9SACH|nr:LAME_0E11518g1_1 [Lachancea meyersii CBS 8951]